MFFNFRNHFLFFIIIVSIFLNSCQLKEPTKNHGLLFLENRSKQLIVDKTNQNDVLNLIGHPHSKSISNENEWIYIERVLTKGQFHKLGKTVLKANNILILNFDKYGVLKEKKLLNKDSKNELQFSKKKTTNDISQKSSVEKFLNSIRSKMYKNK